MATTYMNLTLPSVSVTPGPGWATLLNAAFEAVDAHDHSSGKGPRVTPSGLNIDSDLSMGSNDLTNARSVRYINASGSLGGAADTNCVYVYAGNLYYNNNSGTAIKLTDAGALNAAGLVPSRGQQAVAGTHTILASDTYITLKVNTTAARTINLPAASGVSAGRYYIIQDVSGQSETNAITLARAGSDTIDGVGANFSLSIDNGVWEIESDGASNWKVTRAMPDFLTKSSLTLGSTVLNTSALSVGGNTLNAMTLTLPAAYLSIGTNPATSGIIRLPNLQNIVGRNSTNSGDITIIGVNASDSVSIGGGATAISFNNGSGHLVAGSQVLTTYLSFDQNVASGYLRLPNDGAIYSRNAANNADIATFRLGAADILTVGDGVRQVEGKDVNGNTLHMGSICLFLTGTESNSVNTPVSSSLRVNAPTGSWIYEVEGSVDTQAGSGGYFGMTFPANTAWSAGGWCISGAPNYTGGITGFGAGSSTIFLFDTDGASMPFRFSGHFVNTTAGTVTVMFRPFNNGDYCRITTGTRITLRRARPA